MEYAVNSHKHDLRQLQNLQSVEEFWQQINTFEFDDGRKAFPQLMGLADIVMCLPNSNAECERQFAVMNDVKIKKRNRMEYPLLSSIIIIKSALKARKETFLTFQITEEHLRKMRETNIYANAV